MSKLRLPRPHMPSLRVRVPRVRLGLLVPALVAVLVAAGVAVGHGINSHTVTSGYDLAWLSDPTSGQAVQVDPVAGTANLRMQVAAPGHPLQIEQGDGNLVVIDKRTGKITTIDLSTLLVGGSRAGVPGSAVQVLLAGPRMYVANLTSGSVQAVDPATEADIGTAWSSGQALVDVGLDGAHNVWALGANSTLVKLGWSAARRTLVPQGTSTIRGSGKGSVVIGHDKGVTVVGGNGGVARVGTGHDTQLSAPGVTGPLAAPQSSPTGLVPVAAPKTSSVLIIGTTGVVVDDVAPLGCSRPGVPAAFSGKVYVPCDGAHKVIVLGRDGTSAAAAIPTAGTGDAQLVVSAGHLLINVPGAGSVRVVDGSGRTVQVPTGSRTTGVHNPTEPPPDPPNPPPVTTPPANHRDGNSGNSRGGVPVTHRSTHGKRPGNRGGEAGGTAAGSGPTGATQPTGTLPADAPPTGSGAPTPAPPSNPAPAPTGSGTATAAAQSDGTVLVRWNENTSMPPTGYVVDMTGTDGAKVAQAPAGSSSATVTVLDPGTTAAFEVHAFAGAHELWKATTGIVTTYTRPGSVSGVTVSAGSVSGGTVTLSVSWQPAADHGATVVYRVSTPGASAVTTEQDTAKLRLPCASGCAGSVTVQPTNAAGDGTSGSHTFTVADPTPTQPTEPQPPKQAPPPLPKAGETFVTVTGSTVGVIGRIDDTPATVTLTLTAPKDWATWGAKAAGTCELRDNGTAVGAVACGAAGATKTLQYYANGTHAYTVVATGENGSVSSATVTTQVRLRVNPCPDGAGGVRIAGSVPLHALPYCETCPPGTPQTRCPKPRSAGESLLPGSRPVELAWVILITARSWLQ